MSGGPRQVVNHKIEFDLDRHYSSKVYTSGSTISGRAVVNTQRDVAFDTFDINFVGSAHTRLDFVQQFPTHSSRTFMKLRMPIPASHLPANKIFQAHQTYTIPFNFVVPHQLTIGACNHKCTNDAVRDQHLLLPPSVGGWQGDDQAPEMVQVKYTLVARAMKKLRPPQQSGNVKLFEASKKLKVLPSRPEDAPFDLSPRDERYTLSKSKAVRKNIFSAKAGKLTVATSQPGALMYSADGHQLSSSNAIVDLTFHPTSTDVTPPKINSVTAKLQAVTFFSAAPVNHYPNLGPRDASATHGPSLNYTTTSNLFNKPLGDNNALVWKQEKVNSARRDSGYSSLGVDELISDPEEELTATAKPNHKKKQQQQQTCAIKHTTSINVPFSVPCNNKRFFVPSFHSCIVSRSYTLQVTVTAANNTTFTLSVPLQIGVETVHQPQIQEELPSFEDVMMQDGEEDVDAYFQPRTVRVAPTEVLGGSILPGYDDVRVRAIPVA